MTAFYNENDPTAAAWLRELIAQGHIASGIVDERDIRDIRPDELAGFDQCHFFAGIGGWSLGARLAGIPDDFPIWTGSCPCQPFSAAGGRTGFADERHLWPAFFHLIEQCGPELIAGEQVSGSNVDPWFDLVQADLEGMGYAFGLCPAPSAGFGAPHIRDRAYWLAHADGGDACAKWQQRGGQQRFLASGRSAGRLANPMRGRTRYAPRQSLGAKAAADHGDGCVSWERLRPRIEGASSGLADTNHARLARNDAARRLAQWDQGNEPERVRANDPGSSPTKGFWRDADWLGCTDGKWRPVEPGTFPLADGLPARVGRLRGYGNAINAQQAAAFLSVAMDHFEDAA